jgi:hypothetical protein
VRYVLHINRQLAIIIERASQGKTPQITTFEFPSRALQTFFPILLLLYCTYAPLDNPAAWWDPARWLRATIAPSFMVTASWTFLFVAHACEGLYATHLARKHKMPPAIAVRRLVYIALLACVPIYVRLLRPPTSEVSHYSGTQYS